MQIDKTHGGRSYGDLELDERWQLIGRILATGPFQKSARLPDLLRYMAERSIHGHPEELTEQRIGSAVFGKPVDYSPTEDSSVRVHVRQLRLKLHEYFDCEGRDSEIVVEIPKGAYTPVFRTVKPAVQEPPSPQLTIVPARQTVWQIKTLPWILTAAMTVLALFLWQQLRMSRVQATAPLWPLSEVMGNDQETHMVVADINYGMLRILGEKSGSLDQYLSPQYQQDFMPVKMTERETRLVDYISSSLLTSYADVVAVHALSNLFGGGRSQVIVSSARDLRLRDMRHGNFILVGSPGSNPWVSLFEDQLNFVEREGVVGQSKKFFQNKHPHPGEQESYSGLEFTGTTGLDYATISVLPTETGQGNVLILQGLQQEGTEAAALFLADPEGRKRLEKALGISGTPSKTIHFEALLRTTAVAGASEATEIVATRIINP